MLSQRNKIRSFLRSDIIHLDKYSRPRFMKYLRCEGFALWRNASLICWNRNWHAITWYIKAAVAENVEMQNQLMPLEESLKLLTGKRQFANKILYVFEREKCTIVLSFILTEHLLWEIKSFSLCFKLFINRFYILIYTK